jgi:thymidylate synthase (FAD)
MQVKIKTITPEAEINIVEIARVSSNRTDKSEKPEGLVNYLIKNKHWSPFEHSFITFEIVTSKAIGIQLLRHRSFTFQEFSQRYAKVDNIEQIEFRLQAEKNRQSSTTEIGTVYQSGGEFGNGFFVDNRSEQLTEEQDAYLIKVADKLEELLDLYQEGLELNLAKECVRMVLPLATQTTIYMSGSIRSWIHFLQIRDDAHAQKEVQLIAKEIKRLFIDELPIISAALEYTN